MRILSSKSDLNGCCLIRIRKGIASCREYSVDVLLRDASPYELLDPILKSQADIDKLNAVLEKFRALFRDP